MKLKFLYIIFILAVFFGCYNYRNLDGNYSTCENGEYIEVYFNNDSMRIASDNDWIKLSEWRKIEIKSDTLYFETFGEWKDSLKAEIKYVGVNRTELHILGSNIILDLKPIDENLNLDKPKDFWKGFNNRQNSKNCDLQ